jgi:hypothetical protein
MSRERQAQWSHRLDRLRTLRESFLSAHRYDQHTRSTWSFSACMTAGRMRCFAPSEPDSPHSCCGSSTA